MLTAWQRQVGQYQKFKEAWQGKAAGKDGASVVKYMGKGVEDTEQEGGGVLSFTEERECKLLTCTEIFRQHFVHVLCLMQNP